ncbi:thioredoxin domain-containing protein [Clostridium sp. D53t1_180928_C8]|uniref:thioredoxin domain-containing protein n=1 Tax=Clostridium sp. D53t1_180928_C8 TaxID=2787101 RepID=UPI0018AAE6B2|nr:thioredoxin domain-containing protein [Clostridium sp. D53t1_180928_C8]
MILKGCSINNKEAGLVYGSKSATIEIINYTSFQCPDCSVMHERLHDIIKKYIENGSVRFIEKPIDISRFNYDEVIYKHMSEEQGVDFDKLLDIYSNQSKWIEFDSENDVIKFLELSIDENKKNINDLKIITKEKNNIELKEVPTMFMNGEKIDIDITADEFENKIQEILDNSK